MRSLKRRGQRGGDLLNRLSFGFLGKKEQKPELSNVAGNVVESPNDTPPDTNSRSVSVSPYETPTQTQSPNSPDFCNRCREAHRSGDCTLSVEEAGSGILSEAKKTVVDGVNQKVEELGKTVRSAQNTIADSVIDAGLTAKKMNGGKRKRRKTKKKRRKRKKARKTRKKSSKRRRRRR